MVRSHDELVSERIVPPERRLRVLIVENASGMTGSVRSILHAMGALRDEVDFVVACPENPAFREAGYPLEVFDFLQFGKHALMPMYPWKLVHDARRLVRLTEERGIDVVHVNDFYNLVGVAARLLGMRARLVYHVRLLRRSYLGPVYLPIVRVLLRVADRVICVSEPVLRDVPDSPRKRHVPDGMPAPVIPPRAEHARGDVLRVVYVGHFIRGKGQDLAVEAFAAVARRHPGVRLRFVGDCSGPQSQADFVAEVRARIDAHGLSDRVELVGRVTDTAGELRAADIALNLSDSESFSMVCLEAMMNGIPLIAADSGGPGELLDAEDAGILVPNRDAEAAASALERLVGDAKERRRLGEGGRRRALERYDARVTARALFDVYRELI